MAEFLLNKLGRGKDLENFKSQGITPEYSYLSGSEWCDALKQKLFEECSEVCEANETK